MSIESSVFIEVGLAIVFSIFAWKLKDVISNNKKMYEINKELIKALKVKGIFKEGRGNVVAVAELYLDWLGLRGPFRRAILYLCSSLIVSMAKVAEQYAVAKNEEKKAKTVVGLMLGEKAKKSAKGQLILLLALVIHLIIHFLFQVTVSGLLIIFIAACLLAIQVDQKLIEYRIRKGVYGTNEFETREVIQFIMSHADKDDFNDSGGLKKVIPTPEVLSSEEFTSGLGGMKA